MISKPKFNGEDTQRRAGEVHPLRSLRLSVELICFISVVLGANGAADDKIVFTDVAKEAGIAVKNVSGSLEKKMILESLGNGCAFFDYDNDGFKDIFVANGHIYPQVEWNKTDSTYSQRKLLFKNLGDGSFKEMAAECGQGLMRPEPSRGAAFGDYDNDGDIDVLIANIDDLPTLLRNDGGNRNNFISVKTVGTRSNRSGIGALVKIRTSDGLTQMDQVRGGDSYMSSSDRRIHFGLKNMARIDLLEVAWPSGMVDRIKDVEANQFITVKEGEGIIRSFKANGK